MVKRPSLGAWAALAVAALFALGGAGWWYRTSRPEYRFSHGRDAAGAGDFAVAERYATALEESGQTDLALLLRGHIEYHQGFANRALGYLRQVNGDGEVQTRTTLLAAQCLIALKNPREAEKALLMVVSQNPDQIDAHRLLGVIYYDQGDFRSAMPKPRRHSRNRCGASPTALGQKKLAWNWAKRRSRTSSMPKRSRRCRGWTRTAPPHCGPRPCSRLAGLTSQWRCWIRH